ncbi:hypothetical protein JCM30204_18140 [Dysgonomonas termitidis]
MQFVTEPGEFEFMFGKFFLLWINDVIFHFQSYLCEVLYTKEALFICCLAITKLMLPYFILVEKR